MLRRRRRRRCEEQNLISTLLARLARLAGSPSCQCVSPPRTQQPVAERCVALRCVASVTIKNGNPQRCSLTPHTHPVERESVREFRCGEVG